MASPLNVSLNIIGIGDATLSANCNNSVSDLRTVRNDQILLNIASIHPANKANGSTISVSLKNINFINGIILAVDTKIEIDNCSFDNATLRMVGQHETFTYDSLLERKDDPHYIYTLISPDVTCLSASLTISNTTWYQTTKPNPKTLTEASLIDSDILIKCSSINISLSDSHFGNRRVQIFSKVSLDLQVQNVVFEGSPEGETKVGGITVLLPEMEDSTEIHISDSVFKDLKPSNIFFGRLFSKTIRCAPIVIECPREPIAFQTNNAGVHIVNNSFVSNQRAIALGKLHTAVRITQCLFKNNQVTIDGGAIHTNANSVTITDCKFLKNKGGSFDHYKEVSGDMDFEMYHYNAHITRYEVKDQKLIHYVTYADNTSSMITYGYAGGGGAIYVNNGVLNVSRCDFIQNSAFDSGGAICVLNKASADIKHSYFENPSDIDNTMEGYHIFSIGKKFLVENSSFNNVIVPDNNIDSSALFVFGSREQCNINSLSMKCPSGFNLWVFNSSSKPTSAQNLSTVFDTIYYSCDKCPDRYNLVGGSLNITSTGGPSPSSMSITVSHDEGDCFPCPYGGNCSVQLVAKPNYWGAVDNNTVKFFTCPKGYCCSSLDCEQFDECSYHREGRLCGACQAGYTQALFSTRCIPIDQCKDSWIIMLSIVLGIAYTAFLMFQKDITNFLMSSPVSLQDIGDLCCKCNPHSEKEKGREESLASNSLESVSTVMTEGDQGISVITNGTNGVNGTHPANGSHADSSMTINSNGNSASTATDNVNTNPPASNGGGLLILIFYYFQDAALIKVSTVYVSGTPIIDDLEVIVSEIFRFRFNFFSLIASEVCIFPVMDILVRDFLVAIIAPLLIFFSGVVYVFFKLVYKYTKKEYWNDVALRAVAALMLGLLFSYQKLATTSFSFLHCVPVLGSSVLYIDGTVTCYEYWQWLTLAYVVVCIMPFFLHLAFAPSLLQRGWITFTEFILASLVPLPFLLTWALRFNRCIKKAKKPKSKEAETICGILQGPYRMFKLPSVLKSFCWSGNIMGRRMILMIARTFITNILLSLTIVFATCILSLLQLVHVRPYKDTRFNLVGSVSAGALVIVSCINLLRAAFEVAEYIPQGPILTYMQRMDTAESVVLVWLPLGGLLLLLVGLVFRLTFRFICLIVRSIRQCSCCEMKAASSGKSE